MKAVQIHGDKSSPHIVTTNNIPKPVPHDAEILVQVHAAGVTGDEIMWPEVYKTSTRIPGHEVSGAISIVGPGYDGPLRVGQEVFAFIHADRGQGQAEYAICSGEEVALKPKSISHGQAAALPIPCLTAWEAMTEHARLENSMRILITGASGAVGAILVQLALHLASVEVIALASPQRHQLLKQLGAHSVVDYNTPGWEKLVGDVDAVFDTVGGDVLTSAWNVVKDDGIIVTVADPSPAWAFGRGQAPEAASRPTVKYKYFIVSPNSSRLHDISQLIDDGIIKPLLTKEFYFDAAEEAWTYARQRARGNKAVINFTI